MKTARLETVNEAFEETRPMALCQWGQIPAQLGPFRVIRMLGKGGSARVFLAEETTGFRPGRRVALKVAAPHVKGRNTQYLAFEVSLLSGIHHPHVIEFRGLGRSHGLQYGIMDYIDGWSLRELRRRCGKIPLAICLDIGLQLCSALSHLHGTESDTAVVHCDLKPSNVLMDRFGHVTLIDFGIASSPSRRGTRARRSGTVAYMAPEQILKQTLDGRTDIFALGVLLYEMATGTRLFPGSDIPQLLRRRLYPTYLPKTGFLHAMLGDPLYHVMTALQTAINCNPNDRYATAREFAAALRAVQRKFGANRCAEHWLQRVTRDD